MKKLSFLTILLVFTMFLQSQDIIYKTDKTEIKAKVTEINENSVKYYNFNRLNGPLRVINKNAVFMIIYEDGVREVIEVSTEVHDTNPRNIAGNEKVTHFYYDKELSSVVDKLVLFNETDTYRYATVNRKTKYNLTGKEILFDNNKREVHFNYKISYYVKMSSPFAKYDNNIYDTKLELEILDKDDNILDYKVLTNSEERPINSTTKMTTIYGGVYTYDGETAEYGYSDIRIEDVIIIPKITFGGFKDHNSLKEQGDKIYVSYNTNLLLNFKYKAPPSIMKNDNYGEIVDDRDGRVYRTVKIGNDWWMAENLNYELEFNGNSRIRFSKCVDDKQSKCETYGRLYIWNIQEDICPQGWHISTDDEWKELEKILGMDLQEIEKTGWRGGLSGESSKLRAISGWNSVGLNAVGFGAIPAGNFKGEVFFAKNIMAYFWTSTKENEEDNPCYRSLFSEEDGIRRGKDISQMSGLSIRCVKD